jgi:chromosomal replication initiation ATPase DnaA
MKTKVTFQIGRREDTYYLPPEKICEIFRIIDQDILDERYKMDIKSIAEAVCKHFELESLSTNKTRKNPFPYYRHIFFYISSLTRGNSLDRIGEHIGGYDHTSVIHGRNKIKELINGRYPDAGVLNDVQRVKELLKVENETIEWKTQKLNGAAH